MQVTENKILSHSEIAHKIKRIAYQIYETFSDEDHIVIAGITGGGMALAKRLSETLSEISEFDPELCEVHIDKNNLLEPIHTSVDASAYSNKAVVLVDDVLKSGGTLIYGVKHFLNVPLKKFKTVVLVDRNHKRYPVKADFKGISLSTSLQEHVEVVLDGKDDAVYLR